MTLSAYSTIGRPGIMADRVQPKRPVMFRPDFGLQQSGAWQTAGRATPRGNGEAQLRSAPNVVARAGQEPVNVLLVGDENGMAPLVWSALGDFPDGARLLSRRRARSVREALDIVRHLSVQLVLCELPPGDDGGEQLRALREIGPEVSIVVLVDGGADSSHLDLRDNGHEGLLCRANITPLSMRRIVSRVLERHQLSEKIRVALRRDRLREEILARIADNAPLEDVLNDLTQALQKEVSCEHCVFAVEPEDASDVSANFSSATGSRALTSELETYIGNRLQRSTQRASLQHRQQRCESCVQAMRNGGRLLGELDLVPGISADAQETLNAYTKLGAELAALAIDRMRATETLRQSQAELRELSAQLMHVQERERQRIAGDLHDVIGQSLSVIKVAIEDAEQHFLRTGAPETAAILTRLVPWVKTALGEVRRISMDLRPATIDDLGILPTLSWFFRELGASCRSLSIEPFITVAEADVPEALKIVIFRILQEAICNIVKHAHATRVQVNLNCDDVGLHLSITDNGGGFAIDAQQNRNVPNQANASPPECRSGLGLTSMRERARISGGRFMLESCPGSGTRLSVCWPAA